MVASALEGRLLEMRTQTQVQGKSWTGEVNIS